MSSETRETIVLQLARQHTLNALDANCPIDGFDELVAAGRDLRRFGDTDDRIMADEAERMMNTHNEQTCPTCNPEGNHTMNTNIETTETGSAAGLTWQLGTLPPKIEDTLRGDSAVSVCDLIDALASESEATHMGKHPTQPRVAQAIRVQRVRAGITSEAQLARRAGMSPSGLSKRLAGDIRLDLDEVEALAVALGIDPFDLMEMARPESIDD